MPRIAPKKRAALDILDRLVFNQACVLAISEPSDNGEIEDTYAKSIVALRAVQQRVDEEVVASGKKGVAAEALRHTVYCILEAQTDDNLLSEQANNAADNLDLTDEDGVFISTKSRIMDPIVAERVHEHNQNFFQASIIVLAEKYHGVCGEKALTIANKINEEEKLRQLPAVAKYRLSERLFSLDFPFAPVLFLSWMFRIKALESKKFVLRRVNSGISREFKARVGLLCDFIFTRRFVGSMMNDGSCAPKIFCHLRKGLAKKLSDEAWEQLNEIEFFAERRSREKQRSGNLREVFRLSRIKDRTYVSDCLDFFARNEMNYRFWSGRQHSWIGVIGAGLIHQYHNGKYKDHKITTNGNDYSKFDVSDAREKKTVSEIACEKLIGYGLHCGPGALYETYLESYLKEPTGLHYRAKLYLSAIDSMNLAFPATFEDYIYLATVATRPNNPPKLKNHS